MTPKYDVVWNGTRERGPYLLAEYHPPHTPARDERAASMTDLLREHLALRPRTKQELATVTGLSMPRVHGTLWNLRQSGEVVVVDTRRDAASGQLASVYALSGGASA